MFHLISMYSDFVWPQLYFVVSGVHWNVDWYDTYASLVHLSSWRKIYHIGIHNNWLSLVCTYETRDIMLWKQIQKVLISLATWYHNLYRMSDEVTINLHPLNDWKISFLCPNAARYDVWYNNKLWLRHWHWGLTGYTYLYLLQKCKS